MVRYKLQTFIRVVRDAFETGAGSVSALVSSEAGGVITGRIVERDSGNRRVRNNCEDCRYILEIWEEACRVEEDREVTDDVSSCEEVKVSLVGLRVVAMEPLEAIVVWAPAGTRRDGRLGVIQEREKAMGVSVECQMKTVKGCGCTRASESLGPTVERSMIGPAFGD